MNLITEESDLLGRTIRSIVWLERDVETPNFALIFDDAFAVFDSFGDYEGSTSIYLHTAFSREFNEHFPAENRLRVTVGWQTQEALDLLNAQVDTRRERERAEWERSRITKRQLKEQFPRTYVG